MNASTVASVSPIHGGLQCLVERYATAADAKAWNKLKSINVNETDRTTLYRIADGTLSPLEGPMSEEDYRSVLSRSVIERGGKSWAWTIPIILPVTEDESRELKPGRVVSLRHQEILFGVLETSDVYAWNKAEFIKAVYGTERQDHPGARLWNSDARSLLVGGRITLLPFADERPFGTRVMSPRQTRELVKERGYEQSVAFQTRNPLHRAHEYALVYGAETILRQTGKKTGVILNPLVGQLKGDDVPAATRMETYEALVEGRFLGQGDMDEDLWSSKGQDLNDQLHLIGIDMRMYYGGPKEAVMHAIYRQNLGFTHFIIGRKHADAPYDDKAPIWGDFDSQTIFQRLAGALSISPVNVGFAAYFEELGRVGLVEDNIGKTQVNISGTRMREILGRGELPDERVMRPSTARILAAYYQDNHVG